MLPENQQPAPDQGQAETVALLERTVSQLQEVIEELKTQSAAIPSSSLQTLVRSTQELTAGLKQSPTASPTPESKPLETAKTSPATAVTPPKTPTPSPQLTDRVLPSFERLEKWWKAVLSLVRSLLPDAWEKKLSDSALTGIITGSVIALLLISVLLLPPNSPQTETTARISEDDGANSLPVTSTEAPSDQPSQPTSIPLFSEPPEQPEAEISPPPIETPPELIAPQEPQPVVTAPTPPPKLELTPEQSLIAAIQAQVAQVTSEYSEGLIGTIEANFALSRLTVQVGDEWYELESSRQEELANEMLRRSQQLDFRKLEIIDSGGDLLARSPVVGQAMVIVPRNKS